MDVRAVGERLRVIPESISRRFVQCTVEELNVTIIEVYQCNVSE